MSKIESLNIRAKTWNKDTNGLFDFSTKEIVFSNMSIKKSTFLKRKGNMIKAETKEINKPNEENLLNVFKKGKNEYFFENKFEYNLEPNEKNISEINDKIWYVTNNNKKINEENNDNNKSIINKDYYLVKNDIIKMGRLKFCLIEESLYSGDKKYELNIPYNASEINKINSKQETIFNLIKEVQCLKNENPEEKVTCRICMSEEEDKENNPMVHLCNCKGDINYAHYICIKHWMKTKLITIENKSRTTKTYYIPRFNCEICKAPYPFRFRLPEKEDHIYELIDIERPSTNYVMFESLDQIKENNNNKYIHVIKIINEEEITIGRGIEADIKINDISVSRSHSKLKFNFENKSLLIRDDKSKFGTLVLIRNSFELKEKDNLLLQIGRTIFEAEVPQREKEKIFNCQKVKRIKKENKIEIKTYLLNEENDENKKTGINGINNDINDINGKYLLDIERNDSFDMEIDIIK